MAVSVESLGIDRLSVAERLQLIEQIWDSLPEEVAAVDVPAWHQAELASRRDRADHAPASGRPWREVLDRIEGRR